jgi:predicted nucleotidyltransferase
MNIETINALEKAIKDENVLKKYELEKIGIFGSFARGEPANDIDFYIDAENYIGENVSKLTNALKRVLYKNKYRHIIKTKAAKNGNNGKVAKKRCFSQLR